MLQNLGYGSDGSEPALNGSGTLAVVWGPFKDMARNLGCGSEPPYYNNSLYYQVKLQLIKEEEAS